jgi:hypothetical protein
VSSLSKTVVATSRLSDQGVIIASCAAATAISLGFALLFALRSGLPGLHHDWVWPATRHQFWLRMIQDFSTFSPYGLGGDTDAPNVSFLPIVCWLLSSVGMSSQAILVLVITVIFAIGQVGIYYLLDAAKLRVRAVEAVVLGAAYAFGPISFEKFAAGQLYYIIAYQLLPLFAALTWRCLERRTGWWRLAVGAGLVLTIMEEQIQFVGFCAAVLIILAAALRCPIRDAALRLSVILAIALFRDVPILANFTMNASIGLVTQHATWQWESDLSGRFFSLFQMGGYVGYDVSALPRAFVNYYVIARTLVVALSVLGLVLGLWHPRYRSATAAAFLIAAFALIWAMGLNGPLGPLFTFAMYRTSLFTIVREFYHVMALYSLGAIMLVAIVLSVWKHAALRVSLIALTVTVVPFVFATTIVPSTDLALTAENSCSPIPNLCVLFPTQAPIGYKDQRLYGVDPATLVANSASQASMPVFFEYAVNRLAHGDTAPLEALGVHYIADRPDLTSRLPEVFEPHVGATFEAFRSTQARVRALISTPVNLPSPVQAYVERAGATNLLDRDVADAQVPTGGPGSFTYSYANNGVDRYWVSGRLWAWQFPRLMATASEPVVTRSDAALPLTADAPHGSWCYVLAAADRASLDGVAPSRVVAAAGPYRWFMWHVDEHVSQFEFRALSGGDRAVARVILSEDPAWKPRRVGNTPYGEIAITQLSSRFPWKISGQLPEIRANLPAQFVLARSYSPQWHLIVDGSDRGPAERIHALFNGWVLGRADSLKEFKLVRANQLSATAFNLAEIMVFAGLLVLISWPRLRVRE